MSAISGNSNDPSKLREYYSRRELEINDQHKHEIENLKKGDAEDLDHVRTMASTEIDDAKSRMQEKLTEHDRKHQAEIEALKSLYQKKMEDLARKRSSDSD